MTFHLAVLSQSIWQSVLSHLFIGRGITAAGCSILFYDYALTFSREVEFIWRANWTTVKALFLLNRYGNLIGQIVIALEMAGLFEGSTSRTFCAKIHTFGACFLILSLESIRILVLMRAWTIWGYSRRVMNWFMASYVLYATVVITLAVYAEDVVQFQLLGALPVCLGIEPSFLWLIWFGPLAFDSIAFVMVWHSLRKLSRDRVCFSPLHRLLVQDATMFYIGSIFNNTFAMICWSIYGGDPRSIMELTFAVPLNSIIGQRLVLNLRGLKTRQMSTRALSREVDRQVAAMAHMLFPEVDVELEGSLEEPGFSENEDVNRLGVELQDIRLNRSESGCIEGLSVSEGSLRKSTA